MSNELLFILRHWLTVTDVQYRTLTVLTCFMSVAGSSAVLQIEIQLFYHRYHHFFLKLCWVHLPVTAVIHTFFLSVGLSAVVLSVWVACLQCAWGQNHRPAGGYKPITYTKSVLLSLLHNILQPATGDYIYMMTYLIISGVWNRRYRMISDHSYSYGTLQGLTCLN